jgi:cephalosporin-C deacetylase-like acetyl esterase
MLLGFLAALFGCADAVAQKEDLSVLSGWIEWSDASNALHHTLNGEAFILLEKRTAVIQNLRTPDRWRTRLREMQGILRKVVGPFPEKTPLNAKSMSSTDKPGYRIEKIVYESMPGFYVTGCLFLPAQRVGPTPAILYLSGHTDEAFRNPRYQHVILNLVKKGFIVFAMDPAGQGERLQYYDPASKRSAVGGATTEHSYVGKQCFLSGSSAARYFAWDGIRAIDYLISRPEVDAKRIGVTGLSGGGTQTSYIMALDERVTAAAPSCYITSYRRLLESIGPQDAEQNFNAGLANGIDHADFLEVRAPRPTLLVATTGDFFSIQGARETFEEAKLAFRSLGAENKLDMVEDDSGHGYTRKTREAIYRFFQKHLSQPGDPSDEEFPVIPVEEITVTKTGQVSNSLGGESIFSLNRALAQGLIERLEKSRGDLPNHLLKVKAEALRLSGYQAPGALAGVVFRGRVIREGYRIEKYVLPGEGRCLVPVLLMVPDRGTNAPVLIYLHPQGKAAGTEPGGELESLVKQGYAVLAPDLSGTGETGRVTDAVAFLGVQVGRSIVGIRAADINRCVQFLKNRQNIDHDNIGAVAVGSLTIALLHAAAVNESIKKIVLIEPLVSYQAVVMNCYHSLEPGALIGSVLASYDLPDLAACLAPRKLMMINCVDQLPKPAAADLIDQSLAVARRAYSAKGIAGNFAIQRTSPGQPLADLIGSWLK